MLRKGAKRWWDTTAKSRAPGHLWTWDEFKEAFLKKYYPTSIQSRKEVEFLTLTQGSMTLIEYKQKFEELAHYASEFVDTEDKKARHFEQGVRDDLKRTVIVLQLENYRDVLARAQLADLENHTSGEEKQLNGQSKKKKWMDNMG
ncbi:uncharacterized protein LOC111366785 [Olea europaea var. sylvestris]|uniref:uncharacterized protein LOC111366785 n=1 Tax=Olea europaea var. sylvestris TaxID=158386 RepID=UPI000C1D762E|nr:uncharacterized protein LOC111366785 [Olea europaea var. sylvestris]